MADNENNKKSLIGLYQIDLENVDKILKRYGIKTISNAVRKALCVLAVIAEKERAGYSVYLCKGKEKEKLLIM